MTARRFPWPAAAPIVATVALYVLQIYARESRPPGNSFRLIVTAALVVSFGVTVWSIVRQFALEDEFHRQVQLATLAFAFPASLVVVFAIGLLAGEGTMRWADPRDLPAIMLITYFAGHVIAWRRYR